MVKRIRNPEGNYLAAIMDAMSKWQWTGQPGEVTILNIYHDDNCGIFGGLDCDCNPVMIESPTQSVDKKS
jgi:hypothetical protein